MNCFSLLDFWHMYTNNLINVYLLSVTVYPYRVYLIDF